MAGVLGGALADRGRKVKVTKGRFARRVPLANVAIEAGDFSVELGDSNP